MTTDEKSVCSEAKRLANRRNAMLSTGPKSVEGKNRSRQNAMTHGFCATKVEMPDEDPQAIIDRELEWQAELNPEARAVQGYLIHSVVRQTMKLDRIHESFQATASKRVRDAYKVNNEMKLREIDDLKAMLLSENCNIAVRRLMTTVEGCECLLYEWASLRPGMQPVLEKGAHWDAEDLRRINQLTSQDAYFRKHASSPYVLPTMAIKEYREVAVRLKRNQEPHRISSHLRYNCTSDKIRDEQDAPVLYEKAEAARLFLSKTLEDYVTMLTDLKLKHEAEAAKCHDDLPTMAWFDASDEGRLMHRYEHETHRAIFKGVKDAQTLNRNEAKSTQIVSDDLFTSDEPASPTRPQYPRNEPTATARTNPFPPPSSAPKGDFAFIPMNITPDPTVKKKQ